MNKTTNIQTVDILLNGVVANDINEIEVYDSNVKFSVLVNGKEEKDLRNVSVKWSVSNKKGMASILDDGLFFTGDVMTDALVNVVVSSKNKVKKSVSVKIIEQKDSVLEGISCGCIDPKTHIEGERFDKENYYLVLNFEQYSAKTFDFESPRQTYELDDSEITFVYKEFITSYPVGVNLRTLQSIEIVEEPIKTDYVEGQIFNPYGMRMVAHYEFIDEEIFDYEILNDGPLALGDSYIELVYSFNRVEKTIRQPIEVNPREIISISINDENVQKEYIQGYKFNAENLIVYGNFEEIGLTEVTNYQIEDKILMVGDNSIDITFTENDKTVSATITGLKVYYPYEKTSYIYFSHPENVEVSWHYEYVDDEGQYCYDNTKYAENNLLFDVKNGIYQIPCGALIYIKSVNPLVIDYEINDIRQYCLYSEFCSFSCYMPYDELIIKTIEVSGNRKTIRFTYEYENESGINWINRVFVYDENWNDVLKSEDLELLKTIFKDTDNFYFLFEINSTQMSFDELKNHIFDRTMIINVYKIYLN